MGAVKQWNESLECHRSAHRLADAPHRREINRQQVLGRGTRRGGEANALLMQISFQCLLIPERLNHRQYKHLQISGEIESKCKFYFNLERI